MAFIDVIKYEGSNNILVWKHPREDFNTAAQLIVHESQEAIIFKDGEASEPYTKGKYTIESDNIPGIRRIVGLVTGGISPNHCEVYFINKAYSMNVYWGTATPWTIQDPSLQIPFSLRAHGQFAVRVIDSKQLLLKLVGTMTSFTQKTITDYFKGIFINRIKDHVSSVMINEHIGYSQINSRLSQLSGQVTPQLAAVMEKYGLALEEFAIESISIVEDEAYAKIREAQANRAARIIEGSTIQEERGFNVAMAAAENTGTGGQMGQMMTGIAAGAAVAPAIGGVMRNVMQPMNTIGSGVSAPQVDQFSMGVVHPQASATAASEIICPSCGAKLQAGSRFCNQCGANIVSAVEKETACPVCGAKLPPNSKFCNSCGAKL